MGISCQKDDIQLLIQASYKYTETVWGVESIEYDAFTYIDSIREVLVMYNTGYKIICN